MRIVVDVSSNGHRTTMTAARLNTVSESDIAGIESIEMTEEHNIMLKFSSCYLQYCHTMAIKFN